MAVFCSASELHNEADVETKLIFRILTARRPVGLELLNADIRLKPDIRAFDIGKGTTKKRYHPDFLITICRVPVVLIEAKAPNEDLDEARREARQYALEVNAMYPHGVNPLQLLIVSNGTQTRFARWDEDVPFATFALEELDPTNPRYADIVERLCRPSLEAIALRKAREIYPPKFFRALNTLGGEAIRREELPPNTFGRHIAHEFRHLFNPQTREERRYVVQNAYVPSYRRERFIDPIDRVIRAAIPRSVTDARTIEDTHQPREIIDVLSHPSGLEHQTLLLIGGVGAGKTTFVDYLREVALPATVRAATVWLHVDMNRAPQARDLAYNWLATQLIQQFRIAHPQFDFEDYSSLRRIYEAEIRAIRKGALAQVDKESNDYQVRIADEILRLQRDPIQTARCCVRYFCAQQGKLAIIVLDNCDKRVRDDQLFMFEVSQWLRAEFKCLVVLPLRDSTYDNHRDEPPLDTALKNLVFRIEPPMLSKVLRKRLAIALKQSTQSPGAKTLTYTLPNGMVVEYASTDQAQYLVCILRSLFEYDRFIRRTLTGLSGRDIRRAIEMFLEFCQSGHISEDHIINIRHNKGDYALPAHLVTRILLRFHRRYYDDSASYIKNLFQCDTHDRPPVYTVRLAILRWLEAKSQARSASGPRGYVSLTSLASELARRGVPEEITHREAEFLLDARCIVAEHLRTDKLDPPDLIRIAAPGHVHLDLLRNITYLGSCAEDLWFDAEMSALDVADRIGRPETHFVRATEIENACTLLKCLMESPCAFSSQCKDIIEAKETNLLFSLDDVADTVARAENSELKSNPWFRPDTNLAVGKRVNGLVKSEHNFGVFVKIAPNLDALIPASLMSHAGAPSTPISPGFPIEVEIVATDVTRKRVTVKPIFPQES